VIHLRETCCCSTNLCTWRPNKCLQEKKCVDIRRRERRSGKGVAGKNKRERIWWKERAGKKFAGKIERESSLQERMSGINFAKKNEREWSWRETTSGK
jgi:hypothetical protein